MATDIPHAMNWAPHIAENVVLGPPRWTGVAVLTDVSLVGDERVITIGLVERLVLDAVNGERDLVELCERLAADDVRVPMERLLGILNRFAAYRIVERPFTSGEGLTGIDARRSVAPSVRDDSSVVRGSRGAILGAWRQLGWLALPIPFALMLLVGVVGAVALVLSVPRAWQGLEFGWPTVAVSAAVAVLWHVVVLFTHESAHAATFHQLSGRRPLLGVTRFGIILLPNTTLSGLSLLGARKKSVVVAAGPAVSAALALVPVAVLRMSVAGSWWHQIAALSVCLEFTVLTLGLSFFPNTDASRLLEGWAGVDQIQQVAFRTLTRKYRLPASLPFATRFLVRAYPILLTLTIVAWAWAMARVAWLVLT